MKKLMLLATWAVILLCIAKTSTAQYVVNFDGASDGTHASTYGFTDHTLNGITWTGVQAIVPTTPLAADWFNGTRSLRLRGYSTSAMTMTSNKASGIGTITFNYRRYGTDGQVTWRVDYSTDNGSTWIQAGSNFTAPASDVEQAFSEAVNVTGNVRVRIIHVSGGNTSTNRRLNIDDITITDFTVACATPDQVTGLTATAGDAQVPLSWTNGSCFDEMLVIARAGSAVSFTPTGDGSAYTANATLGSGTNVGSSQFAVFKGSSNSVTVTGLTNGTTYHFAVYTRKGTTWTAAVTTSATPVESGYYWNGGSIAANPANGGTGTWGTTNAWRQPTATGAQATWANGIKAILAGTAGTVTLDANRAPTLTSLMTSGYSLITSNGTTRTLSGPILLSNNVSLTIAPNSGNAGNGTIGIESVSGTGTASLNIANNITTGTCRVNLTGTTPEVSVPVTISGAGTGLAGVVSVTPGAVISGNITNTATTARTMIGATSGNAIAVNGVISGNNGVQFSAGADGGAGIITLNSPNTYTGPSVINFSTTGVLRLGVDNALATGTALEFGIGSDNHGAVDLNGRSQTVASIAKIGTGSTNGIANTGGAASLIVSGSAATAYSAVIGQPTNTTNLPTWNNNISLTRSGTGITLLSGANTYIGTTTISGGTLIVNGSLAAGSAVSVNGGTLAGSGTAAGTVAIAASAILSPGGTLTGSTTANLNTGALTLQTNANLTIDINNASGTAGAASGWDKVTSSGAVTINATSGSPVQITLNGLTAGNVAGAVPNFSNGVGYSWTILSGTSISGFAANKFVVNAAGFTSNNPLAGGTFSVAQVGNDINLVFTPNVVSPTITLSGSLNAFSTNLGTPSATQSYTVSGSGLTENIVITAPAGYHLRKGVEAFSGSTTLTQTGGNVANTTIDVRLTGATAGSWTGNITHVSAGSNDPDQAVNGFVIPNIVINEIHYNPSDAQGVDTQWEFFELYNAGADAVDISGYVISQGVVYTFPSNSIIEAGEYIIVCVVAANYTGNGYDVYQWTSGALSNGGETLELETNGGHTVDIVTYGTSGAWTTAPNGGGPSLELINPSLDNALASSWQASYTGYGTPGAANSTPVTTFYSRSSGLYSAAIWETTPGTGGTPFTVTFDNTKSFVIQNGHTVTLNNSSIALNNLTVDAGGTLLSSTDNNDPTYFNVFGNLICNGTIGHATNGISFNFEGISQTVSGNGSMTAARIRKNTVTNTTTSVTLSKDITLVFGGAGISSNANSTNIHFTIASGYTVNVIGSNGTNGDVSIDGTNGASPNHRGGSITVNGTLLVSNKLFAMSNNIATYPCSMTIGPNGRIKAKDVDIDIDGTAFTAFNINSGGVLEIDGILAVKGGTLTANNGVLINSGAQLLHGVGTTNGGGAVSGNITVRRQGSASNTVYNYWSTPVVGGSLPGSNGYYYDPAQGTLTNADDNTGSGDPGWQPHSGGMTNGQGYASTGAGLASFTGVANNDNVTYSVNNPTGSVPGSSNFNLIGNPYPSAISADLFIAQNGPVAAGGSGRLAGALYFWDDDNSGGSLYNTNDYAVWTRTGATAGSGSPSAQGTSPIGSVATGQGFKVEAVSSGIITFTNGMRGGSNTQFFKLEEEQQVDRLWLNLTGNTHFNQILVAFRDDATEERDLLYDAYKVRGNANISLGAVQQDKDYSIVAFPSLTTERTVPLMTYVSQAGTYTFSADSIDGFEGYTVYLEDLQNGQLHVLQQDGSVNVQMGPQDEYDRFQLRFSSELVTEIEDGSTQQVSRIISSEMGLQVLMAAGVNTNGELRLFNAMGQLLLSQNVRVDAGRSSLLDVSTLPAGIYVAAFRSSQGVVNAKVVLR